MDKLIAAIAEFSKLANRLFQQFSKTASEKVQKGSVAVRKYVDHIRKIGRPKW